MAVIWKLGMIGIWIQKRRFRRDSGVWNGFRRLGIWRPGGSEETMKFTDSEFWNGFRRLGFWSLKFEARILEIGRFRRGYEIDVFWILKWIQKARILEIRRFRRSSEIQRFWSLQRIQKALKGSWGLNWKYRIQKAGFWSKDSEGWISRILRILKSSKFRNLQNL